MLHNCGGIPGFLDTVMEGSGKDDITVTCNCMRFNIK